MFFGVINACKPAGISSRQMVNHVVKRCPRKTKVGHAGTLDPMATGVLVIAVGPATKLIQYAQSSKKTYVGEFRLGLSSDTEDITGEVTELSSSCVPSELRLVESLMKFQGEITQIPPQYSAVKVNGQRAYKVARSGGRVEIAARKATIHAIRLLKYEYPNFKIEVECSKGTYIRTLGRDIAKNLGTDAVMISLERTHVGKFDLARSHSLEEIDNTPMERLLLPPSELVSHLDEIVLTGAEFDRLVHGKSLDSGRWAPILRQSAELAAFSQSGQLVSVLNRNSEDSYGTKVNFAPLLK